MKGYAADSQGLDRVAHTGVDRPDIPGGSGGEDGDLVPERREEFGVKGAAPPGCRGCGAEDPGDDLAERDDVEVRGAALRRGRGGEFRRPVGDALLDPLPVLRAPPAERLRLLAGSSGGSSVCRRCGCTSPPPGRTRRSWRSSRRRPRRGPPAPPAPPPHRAG
ncbi:MAG: hypothetical protein ACOX0O_08455 [Candidatus Methanoculleus thermohydrogenotrophicum]